MLTMLVGCVVRSTCPITKSLLVDSPNKEILFSIKIAKHSSVRFVFSVIICRIRVKMTLAVTKFYVLPNQPSHISLLLSDVQSVVMRQHIENLQDQAQVMLGDYTRQYYPGNSARFGKLILSLQLLRTVDQDLLRNCLQQPRALHLYPVHFEQKSPDL